MFKPQKLINLHYMENHPLQTVLPDIRLSFDSDERFHLFLSLYDQFFSSHPQPEKSAHQFTRIWKHSISQVLFLRSLIDSPAHFELLANLILKSDYFTDNLVRDPHLFSWLQNTNILSGQFPVEKMQKDGQRSAEGSDQRSTRIRLLKQFHRKYTVAIGARDLLRLDSVKETTSYLSFLADTILLHVSELLNHEFFKDGKVPGFAVFALGKYGGRELNYSSDIDLIAVCESDSEIEWRGRVLPQTDILQRWIQAFVDIIGQPDADGYFYRVDFRLRPDGEFGPLIPTANGALDYYFSRGRNWERQMLLKIRMILGDQTLSDSFLSGLKSFIFNPLRQIMGIEHLHQSLKAVHENQKFNLRNIKTTPGGIRSIEFFCQTVQLEIGGYHPELWNGNTLEVLSLLKAQNLIKEQDADQLTEAYCFYRQIEHHLQFHQNLQTHEIPKPGIEFNQFAARFSKSKPGNLELLILKYRECVLGIVDYYFPEPVKSEDIVHPVINCLQTWGELPKEIRQVILHKNFKRIDSVVSSFDRIFKAFPSPSSLLSLLTSDLSFMKHVLRLLDDAPSVVSKLISMPDIWEGLILNRPANRYEEEDLHRYQTYAEIWSALAFTSGRFSLDDYFKSITEMYDHILISRFSENQNLSDEILLIALGKLGSCELASGSDADLVVFSLKSTDPKVSAEFKKTNQVFSVYTQYGIHFDVDYRLRPEGKNAPVLPDLQSSLPYYENRADYWEFQTFTRARRLLGSESAFREFQNELDRIYTVRQETFPSRFLHLRQARMNQHKSDPLSVSLKKDAGGILDIESLVQHLCLRSGFLFSDLGGKPMSELFRLLNAKMKDERLARLDLLYREYRRFEVEQKLADQYKSGLFSPKTVIISSVIRDFATLRNFITESKQLIEQLIRENT